MKFILKIKRWCPAFAYSLVWWFNVQQVSGQPTRVLFLGNSYTAVNNLPQLVTDLALSAGDSLVFDSYIPGGATLQAHSLNSTSNTKIMQGNWDYLVLQEQSQRPSFPLNQVLVEVFPFARYLDSLHSVYSPCGETMFYMTWGRKNGDAGVCPAWPPVCTYHGMDSLLRLRYLMLADSNDAVVSPVGSVWRYLRQHHPSIELYQPDESHPSSAGSYAAACSFYAAIFRKDPTLASYNFSIGPADAAIIRDAARMVVFDSLANWNIGKYDLLGDFTYVQTTGYTYQFTSQGQQVAGQVWDFGTATDTTAHPSFTFPGPGSYFAQLTSFNACDTVVTGKTIVVTASGVHHGQPAGGLDIRFDPDVNLLEIGLQQGTFVEILMFDMMGRQVYKRSIRTRQVEIFTGNFTPGVYLLKAQAGVRQDAAKLVLY